MTIYWPGSNNWSGLLFVFLYEYVNWVSQLTPIFQRCLSKRSSRESTNNQIPVLQAQNAWSRVRKKVHEPKFRMAVKTTAADHLNNAMSIQLVPIYDYRNIHVYAYYVWLRQLIKYYSKWAWALFYSPCGKNLNNTFLFIEDWKNLWYRPKVVITVVKYLLPMYVFCFCFYIFFLRAGT